jgi:hypothetical protein
MELCVNSSCCSPEFCFAGATTIAAAAAVLAAAAAQFPFRY